MKRTTLVLAASILTCICASSCRDSSGNRNVTPKMETMRDAPTQANLLLGDTLRYTMTFLSQSAVGFVTAMDSNVRVPAAKVVFTGQLFRPGFLPSTVQKDTVVVMGGNFPASLDLALSISDTMPYYLHGYQAGRADSLPTDVVDSLRAILSLLRWGIKTISYTDSVFWKFHEREIGVKAKNYFAASYTDAQVDSIRQSGAVIYFMGSKSGNKTPIRGYGQ